MNSSEHRSTAVPFIRLKSGSKNQWLWETLLVFFGAAALAMLAQISIHVPGTPVPITGQTFGTALLALTYGQRRGLAAFCTYYALGSMNVPVFALGGSGFALGPTSGYLVGMVLAIALVGALVDRGFTNTFLKTWAATVLGSVVIFSFGLLVLGHFIGYHHILQAGLLPFLPGDIIKDLLAASIAWQAHQRFSHNR